MSDSGIQLPCIVKPRVACGTPEAHHMALILRQEGFQEMQVSNKSASNMYILVWKPSAHIAREEMHFECTICLVCYKAARVPAAGGVRCLANIVMLVAFTCCS